MRALPQLQVIENLGQLDSEELKPTVTVRSGRREKLFDILFALKRAFDFSRFGRTRFRTYRNDLWDAYYLAQMFMELGYLDRAQNHLSQTKRILDQLVKGHKHMGAVNRLFYSALKFRLERMELMLQPKRDLTLKEAKKQ